MATTWNTDRWADRGVNDAGDRVYERKVGEPKKAAAKKTTAKKKA